MVSSLEIFQSRVHYEEVEILQRDCNIKETAGLECYIAQGSNINYNRSDIGRAIFIIFMVLVHYHKSSLVKSNLETKGGKKRK